MYLSKNRLQLAIIAHITLATDTISYIKTKVLSHQNLTFSIATMFRYKFNISCSHKMFSFDFFVTSFMRFVINIISFVTKKFYFEANVQIVRRLNFPCVNVITERS